MKEHGWAVDWNMGIVEGEIETFDDHLAEATFRHDGRERFKVYRSSNVFTRYEDAVAARLDQLEEKELIARQALRSAQRSLDRVLWEMEQLNAAPSSTGYKSE